MKKALLFLAAFISTGLLMPAHAQKKLKEIISLQMPEGDGSNSAGLAWHPVQKKYYTSMAGNAIYAMSVFTANGKVVQENVDAENDYRGFWYNPVSKRVEFNCYSDGGIGHLELNAKGEIKSKEIDLLGMNQPDEQCVGVYYPVGNNIIFLNTGYTVEKYTAKTGEVVGDLVTIKPGCKKQAEADELDAETEASRWEDRNTSSVQFTGMPNAELAVLNVADHTIELYSTKTGLLTKTAFKIPESVALYPNFNFCYCNGIWWFFNKELRKWVGCK
jgi:WD40 repeat protein